MRSTLIATVIACVLPAIASASTYRASNDLNVVPLSGSTFEVIASNGEGPRGLWCAAAEYSERRLGKFDRVYIAKALRKLKPPSRSRKLPGWCWSAYGPRDPVLSRLRARRSAPAALTALQRGHPACAALVPQRHTLYSRQFLDYPKPMG